MTAANEQPTPAESWPEWLTAAQVKEISQYCQVTVWRKLESGELHGHKPGRQWRVHRDALKAWLLGADGRSACDCPPPVVKFRRRSG